LALFLLGAVLMRGAGCTFNDIVDRDFDSQVARTRSRPLPSGQVSVPAAVAFMLALGLLSLLILIQLNAVAITVGLAAMLPITVYPFMKRFTYWPQFFLGIAFNWGALLGWAAVMRSLGLPAILLYGGGIAWTLAYDTIYAHQDKEDDLLIGVKSTALKFGVETGRWLIVFFTVALLMIALAGWTAGAGIIYMTSVAGATLHATWQLSRLDTDQPASCLKVFRSNRDFGLILFAGAMIDSVIKGSSPT
jgi:4-hydroxybenzoate polyprenyltransferase